MYVISAVANAACPYQSSLAKIDVRMKRGIIQVVGLNVPFLDTSPRVIGLFPSTVLEKYRPISSGLHLH